MTLRVLAVSHVFPRSAQDPSAPFLLTWARGLHDAGASVGVVAPHDAGLPGRHEVSGVPVRRVRYASDDAEVIAYRGEMHQLVRSPRGLLGLAALVEATAVAVRVQARAGGADVVHVHWWVPSLLAVRLARPSAGVVVTLHGTDVALLESRPQLVPLARWALACADRVEAVSSDLAGRLERATGRRADGLNPMPLKPAWFAVARPPRATPDSDRSSAAPQLLGVGRLVPDKGFADLLDAVALLGRPVRVRLVGEGPQREALAARAATLNLDLELIGRIDTGSLRAAYAAADLVVQPSHREGLGLVAAEGLLAGVPVVATDSGGVRDVLPDSRLVPVGDVPALAAAIARQLDDPDRTWVHTAAERLRTRLTPSASAARTLQGYTASLDLAPPAPPSPDSGPG